MNFEINYHPNLFREDTKQGGNEMLRSELAILNSQIKHKNISINIVYQPVVYDLMDFIFDVKINKSTNQISKFKKIENPSN